MENKKLIKDLSTSELSLKEDELYEYKGEDRVVSAQELYDELLLSDDAIFNFKTGIPSMDRILEGVECGELVVITGLSGQGKTTLMMTLTNNMAQAGVKSVWFTLEVTPRQFLKKMMASTNTIPDFFVPRENTTNTIKWIEERIVESSVKFNTKVVFIDHINMIYSLEASKGNVSLEIGDLVAKIKQIALKHNLIIFLVAHCKDPMDNKEPTERSIRDSGLILRFADIAMGIWRVKNGKESDRLEELEEDDTWAKLRIWKNRRTGKLGRMYFTHNNHFLLEVTTDFSGMVSGIKEVKRQNDFYGD